MMKTQCAFSIHSYPSYDYLSLCVAYLFFGTFFILLFQLVNQRQPLRAT